MMVYEKTAMFSASFTKGDNFHNFLFASLDSKMLSIRSQLLKVGSCSNNDNSVVVFFFPFLCSI